MLALGIVVAVVPSSLPGLAPSMYDRKERNG
jgi:hypothetical protein